MGICPGQERHEVIELVDGSVSSRWCWKVANLGMILCSLCLRSQGIKLGERLFGLYVGHVSLRLFVKSMVP